MKIAMIFPGYGSQYVGMAKELYDEHRIIQEYFEEASTCLDMNFIKLCFASSDSELARFENAYVSLFLVSYSLSKLLQQQGITPLAVAGCDVGEYSALASVGGLTLPDGLYFLSKYALLYQEYLQENPTLFFDIQKVTYDEIEELLHDKKIKQDCKISGVFPNRVIVSMLRKKEETVRKLFDVHSLSYDEESAGFGLHNAFAQSLVPGMEEYTHKIDFRSIEVPLIANWAGELVKDAREIKEAAMNSLQHPVRWDIVIKKLAGMDVLIEIGPGTTLTKKLKKLFPDIEMLTFNKPSDLENILHYITNRQSAESLQE